MVAREPRSLKELILLMLVYPSPLQLVIVIAFIHFLQSFSGALKEIIRELLALLLMGG